ncbi:MAG: DNA mismatch repair protein MutT, partial [Chitinophagales bacterium]
SNSVSDEYGIFYLAKGLTFGEAEPEATEDLQVRKLPFTELVEMVMQGEITDAFTVCAVLKAKILLGY